MSDARFPHLLAPGRIGTLRLRNRIVLTPMGTNLEAEDGTPGERITRFYEERARGGVGLVVVGVTGVAWPYGVSNPNNMGLSEERHVVAFRALTDRIHAAGAAIAVQLQHAGRVALQDVVAGRPRWAPSILPDDAGDLMEALTRDEVGAVARPFLGEGANTAYHEMDASDVAQLGEWFAAAAERAVRAGFDAIELHAGHGYIFSSFLSPSTNRRDDAYGGPLEQRARPLLETIRAVRDRVGPDFPLWCRLDGAELHKSGGITEEDARRTAELAVEAGLDALHVSAYADPRSGVAFTEAPLPHRPSAYVELARGIKGRVDVPVIAVGRIEPDAAETLIAEGGADFVAMGRRLLADPQLPAKLADPSLGATRPCLYSYRCVGNVFLRDASRCTANPALGREAERTLAPTDAPRRVLVAGGGPAGLEVARVLRVRGHAVTLCERSDRLGGLARTAGAADASNAPLVPYLEHEVRRLGVDVRLETEVTPALARELAPDVAIVAVGATTARPPLPGVDAPQVLARSDLREDASPLLARGPRVAIVGGDLVGVALAGWLAREGAEVSVLHSDRTLAPEMPPPRRWRALHALTTSGVRLLRGATPIAFETGRLHYRDAEGEERALEFDTAVLADAIASSPALADALRDAGLPVHVIGDGRTRGYLEGAFEDAWACGLEL